MVGRGGERRDPDHDQGIERRRDTHRAPSRGGHHSTVEGRRDVVRVTLERSGEMEDLLGGVQRSEAFALVLGHRRDQPRHPSRPAEAEPPAHWDRRADEHASHSAELAERPDCRVLLLRRIC